MKTDLYTKSVLTIIAICLSIMVAKEFLYAGTSYQNINVPINPDGSINAKIISSEKMDVNLIEVDGSPVRNNKGKLIVDVR